MRGMWVGGWIRVSVFVLLSHEFCALCAHVRRRVYAEVSVSVDLNSADASRFSQPPVYLFSSDLFECMFVCRRD